MGKLLYIKASPRLERSHSSNVAQAFLDAYAAGHPDDDIVTLDLWTTPLPEINGRTLSAKYSILHGEAVRPEDKDCWGEVEQAIAAFKDAEKYVFSLPMWNFSIPYRLKHYVDVITQPGYTFSFDPESGGYTGLVTSRPVLLVCARGGAYPEDLSHLDYQTSYMQMWLGFIGFTDIRKIVVEPSLGDPAEFQSARDTALEQARSLAKAF